VTHQSAPSVPTAAADPGRAVAELRHVLGLVEEIAGRAPAGSEAAALDEAARIEAAHAHAWPIAQRRFDRLAAETASWAAAGVEVLIALEESGRPATTAAAKLADELSAALDRLEPILTGSLRHSRSA
jgi:hypothetical protein